MGPSSAASSTSVDWSKLINKPQAFDHASLEAEIKAFRDWSWQLGQFLIAIDPSYDDELKKIFEDPSKGLDMVSASADTRNRSTKLYGLLGSLVRGKALGLVKSVNGSDGYEALRQMCLALRPNSNTRGLALLSAATSWPAFQMNAALQPQMLKLEEVFEDSRRAGTDIQDAVKAAILLRCVSGQLKTYLNLGAQDDMSDASLREQCLKWDKAQQRWSTLVASDDAAVSMEIDRVEGKGWHGAAGKKGKGKGKSDKGPSKGKGKSKTKSKDGKGKSKKGSDKGKGRADDRSKGKGKGDRQCYPLRQGLLARWTTSEGCCTECSPTSTGQYGFLSDRGPRFPIELNNWKLHAFDKRLQSGSSSSAICSSVKSASSGTYC